MANEELFSVKDSDILIKEEAEAPLALRRPKKKRKYTKKDPLTGKVIKTPVRTRRKKGHVTGPEDNKKIVLAYVEGASAIELADKYRVSTDHINRVVNTHWQNLTNLREARMLSVGISEPPQGVVSSAYTALDKIQRANKGLNGDFLAMLSDSKDLTLTEPEIQFALLYVSTGSGSTALKKAGLDEGVIKGKSSGSAHSGTRLAIELRVEYMKNKPNVAAYINELRTEKYVPQAVDLQHIQRELLEQIETCKADESMTSFRKKSMTHKLTVDLGKTIGAFSDRVVVEHVDPAAALDYLSQLNEVEAKIVHPIIEITPESTPELLDES